MDPENLGIRADLASRSRLIRAQGRDRSTRARTGQAFRDRRRWKSYRRHEFLNSIAGLRCPMSSYASFFRTYTKFSRTPIAGMRELIDHSYARRLR